MENGKNEIKKVLYKENPQAFLKFIRGGTAYYTAGSIEFEIPVSDMGTADFYPQMDSKMLIRWLVTESF